MGVSQAMVSKWESGDYNFSCDSLEPLLKKIGLKLSIEEKELISVSDYGDKLISDKYFSECFIPPSISDISAVIYPKVNNVKITYNSNNGPDYMAI